MWPEGAVSSKGLLAQPGTSCCSNRRTRNTSQHRLLHVVKAWHDGRGRVILGRNQRHTWCFRFDVGFARAQASEKELSSSNRRAVLEWHPDRHVDKGPA